MLPPLSGMPSCVKSVTFNLQSFKTAPKTRIYLKFIICRLSFFAIPGPSLLLVVVEVVVCVFVSLFVCVVCV